MDEDFITEYEQSFENWRFFVGLRFTVLAFFLTLTSALIYAAFTLPIFHEKLYQCLVSIIGIASSWSIIMFEGRNRQLYYECIKRAKEIEGSNGLAHKIDRVPPKPWAWHTGAFRVLYLIPLSIWILLLIASICNNFPVISTPVLK